MLHVYFSRALVVRVLLYCPALDRSAFSSGHAHEQNEIQRQRNPTPKSTRQRRSHICSVSFSLTALRVILATNSPSTPVHVSRSCATSIRYLPLLGKLSRPIEGPSVGWSINPSVGRAVGRSAPAGGRKRRGSSVSTAEFGGIRFNFGRLRPKPDVGQHRPDFDEVQFGPQLARFRPSVGQCLPSSSKYTRCQPNRAKSGPMSAKVWPCSTAFGPSSDNLARSRDNSGVLAETRQIWSSTKLGPISVKFGPETPFLANSGEFGPTQAIRLPKVGRFRPTSARIPTVVARHR